MSTLTSTCILCMCNFAPTKCETNQEVDEHRKCLDNFLKCLQVPEEERIQFQNVDFENDLSFCKTCYLLPQELSSRFSSKGELEEEVLGLQQGLCQKIRDLSESIEKVDDTFLKVKEQAYVAESVKTSRRQERKKKRLEDLGEDATSLSANLDEKFEKLRRLVLEWTPGKVKIELSQHRAQQSNIKLMQGYPLNFVTLLNDEDEDIICKLEPKDFEFEDSVGEIPSPTGEDTNEVQEDDETKKGGVPDSVSLRSPISQDEDQNDSDSIRGTMGDESACDDFSENSCSASQKTKGTERSRKRKRNTVAGDNDGLSNSDGEPLDPALGTTEDSCGSEESDDSKRSAKKSKNENKDPLTFEETQAALSYKYYKVLGKYEILEEKIMFKGFEIKNIENSGYECTACGVSKTCDFANVFSVRGVGLSLRKHIQVEHLDGYKCQWCTDTPEPFCCTSLYSLLLHIRSEHNIDEHECNICGQPFKNRKEFLNHQEWSHLNEAEKVEAIKKRKEEMEVDGLKNQCSQCKNVFANGNDLKRHLKLHSDEREKPRIPCQYCGNLFDPNSMQQHVKLVHKKPEVQWYPCEFCDLKFYSETVLERHIRRIHALDTEVNLKPYSCQFCHQLFSTRDDLDSHKEECHTEVGLLPDSTDDHLPRGRTRSSKKGKKHNKGEQTDTKRTRGRPRISPVGKSHKCSICPSSFARRDRLTRHINTVHAKLNGEGTAYECHLCDSSYNRNDRLTRHMKMTHSIVAPKNQKKSSTTTTSKS